MADLRRIAKRLRRNATTIFVALVFFLIITAVLVTNLREYLAIGDEVRPLYSVDLWPRLSPLWSFRTQLSHDTLRLPGGRHISPLVVLRPTSAQSWRADNRSPLCSILSHCHRSRERPWFSLRLPHGSNMPPSLLYADRVKPLPEQLALPRCPRRPRLWQVRWVAAWERRQPVPRHALRRRAPRRP